MIRIWYLAVATLLAISGAVHSQSLIFCQSTSKQSSQSIWPQPYVAQNAELCFNVKDWPEYAGKNCVATGGEARWKAEILLVIEGAGTYLSFAS